MSGSLGTPQNSEGAGLSAADHRRILAALYPNTGVIDGLKVTGGSGLTYHVDPGVGVASRAESDGNRIFYYAGGNTAAVPAGDGGNPRIDVVWIQCDDPTMDSDSVDVHVGTTIGTPAASPVEPVAPAGATRLAAFIVAPGTTSLSSGATLNSDVDYLIPYGGSLGRLAYVRDSSDYSLPRDTKWHNMLKDDFDVPTDRLVRVEWKARATTGVWDANYMNSTTSYYCQLLVDNKPINEIRRPDDIGFCDEIPVGAYWGIGNVSYIVEVPKGHHTAAIRATFNRGGINTPVHFIQSKQLSVFDEGVAK